MHARVSFASEKDSEGRTCMSESHASPTVPYYTSPESVQTVPSYTSLDRPRSDALLGGAVMV